MRKKIAIIGSGYMAEEHIKVVQAISNCKVAGIMSRNSETASNLAAKYSIPIVTSKIEIFMTVQKLMG